jgi:hypothetical protein
LVVIHDPELRDVAVVTVAAEQHASVGGTFVPIFNGFLLPSSSVSHFKETSTALHQLIVSPGASGRVPIRIERP